MPDPLIPQPADATDDYARVAAAINWLQAQRDSQPGLTALAHAMGLSVSHMQRLFTRWAGISPKRFVQSLTLDAARARLLQAPDLLRLSHEIGLSGPGRLHDLFVTFEAMTPGEARHGGAGVTLHWSVHATPFGPALVVLRGQAVCRVHFLAAGETPATLLAAAWPAARLIDAPDSGAAVAARLAAPHATAPLAVWLPGSAFQLQVWRALLAIPPGRLASYGALAQALGRPAAARAVGNAVAANPLAVLIPCHRVIRASGALGAYRWGVTRKRALQAHEAAGTPV